jgi:hypothetical protein
VSWERRKGYVVGEREMIAMLAVLPLSPERATQSLCSGTKLPVVEIAAGMGVHGTGRRS